MSGPKPTTHPATGGGGAPAACATGKCPLARKVVKITARVPTTQSVRGKFSKAPPFKYHEFHSTSTDKSLTGNAPTVLVRNCAAIELNVETQPPNQKDVKWSVVANPGPRVPALTPSGMKAKLGTNTSGGYSIAAQLDATVVYWNLVLVEIEVTDSAIVRNSDQFVDDSDANFVSSKSGEFEINDATKCAMHATANIKLTAGKQASLDKYCDKVTVGMVNVLRLDSAQANYDPKGRERERIPSVSGASRIVVDPAVKVIDLGYPILDRGADAATRATGGDTIYLSKTQSTPTTGTTRKVETCDSPVVSFHALLPEFNKPSVKKAKSIEGVNSFSLHLTAFSSDANYSYVTWGTAPWTANYSGAITFTGTTPKWTKGPKCGVTGAGLSFTLIKDGKEAKAAGTEVRPPVFLTYILDAR